jgi:hypothetical protein
LCTISYNHYSKACILPKHSKKRQLHKGNGNVIDGCSTSKFYNGKSSNSTPSSHFWSDLLLICVIWTALSTTSVLPHKMTSVTVQMDILRIVSDPFRTASINISMLICVIWTALSTTSVLPHKMTSVTVQMDILPIVSDPFQTASFQYIHANIGKYGQN